MIKHIHELSYQEKAVASERFHLHTGKTQFDYPLGLMAGFFVIHPIDENLCSTICYSHNPNSESLVGMLNLMKITTEFIDEVLHHLSIEQNHPWYKITVPESHPEYGKTLTLKLAATSCPQPADLST